MRQLSTPRSRGHDSLASLSPERDLGGLDIQVVLILDVRGVDREVDDILDSMVQVDHICQPQIHKGNPVETGVER